jgi:hypothetical protein
MSETHDSTTAPNSSDLSKFAAAVRLRDRATAAATAHHERAGLQPSGHYARATYDAVAEMIRQDERERLAVAAPGPDAPYVDLAKVSPWLDLCGSCDAGLPQGCTHPDGDYRPVMGRLVEEVRWWRAQSNTSLGQTPS